MKDRPNQFMRTGGSGHCDSGCDGVDWFWNVRLRFVVGVWIAVGVDFGWVVLDRGWVDHGLEAE